MIHPKLESALGSLQPLGFTLQSYAGAPKGEPSLKVVTASTINVTEQITFPMFVDASITPEGDTLARVYAIVGIVTVNSGDFSFPHPRLNQQIDTVRRAAIAVAHEMQNGCSLSWCAGILHKIASDLDAGRVSRALSLARVAQAEIGNPDSAPTG